jgi:predicted amidohydrolase
MKIALVQNHPVFGDKTGNTARLVAAMESAPSDLYVLPELAYSGYQFTSADEARGLAEGLGSPSIEAFRDASRRLDACVVFGFPELAGDRLYNSSLALLPDGSERLYRKTHLFYKEKLYFSPGDTGFKVFDFRGARIGMAICFDWFFPESFRTLAAKGADIVAHSSNLVLPYCQRADFAAAVQNKLFIATANRVGTENREDEALTFTGGSVLVSPKGDYLLEGPAEAEAVLTAEIDPAAARNKRLNPWNDAFADRRPEFYRR